MNETKTKFIEECETLLPIDNDDLDMECSQQPALYFRVGRWAAAQIANAKRAKSNRDRVISEFAVKVRRTPKVFGLERVTDAAIDKAVRLDPLYQEAYEAYAGAIEMEEIARALLAAFEQRRTMLTQVVRINLSQLFQGMDIDSSMQETLKAVAKSVARKTAEKAVVQTRKDKVESEKEKDTATKDEDTDRGSEVKKEGQTKKRRRRSKTSA